MQKLLVTIGAIAAAQIGHAEECGELGLKNSYLVEYFCDQLKGVSGPKSTTRSVFGNDDNEDLEAGAPFEQWPGFDVLQDAYRADPKKTLELIARIKKAGGLGSE